MRFLIIVLLCSLALLSCKKEEKSNLTIEGRVVDPNSGNAVGGVTVDLKAQEVSGGTFNSNFVTIATRQTASDGRYNFNFERSNASAYRLEFNKANYFEEVIDINPDNLSADQSNTYDVEINAMAWYSIHITNSNPFDGNDSLIYQLTEGNINCSNPCCSGDLKYFEGTTVDTTLTCLLYGSAYAVFNAFAIKNGNSIPYSDSIYCPPGDTGFYQLNY